MKIYLIFIWCLMVICNFNVISEDDVVNNEQEAVNMEIIEADVDTDEDMGRIEAKDEASLNQEQKSALKEPLIIDDKVTDTSKKEENKVVPDKNKKSKAKIDTSNKLKKKKIVSGKNKKSKSKIDASNKLKKKKIVSGKNKKSKSKIDASSKLKKKKIVSDKKKKSKVKMNTKTKAKKKGEEKIIY